MKEETNFTLVECEVWDELDAEIKKVNTFKNFSGWHESVSISPIKRGRILMIPYEKISETQVLLKLHRYEWCKNRQIRIGGHEKMLFNVQFFVVKKKDKTYYNVCPSYSKMGLPSTPVLYDVAHPDFDFFLNQSRLNLGIPGHERNAILAKSLIAYAAKIALFSKSQIAEIQRGIKTPTGEFYETTCKITGCR